MQRWFYRIFGLALLCCALAAQADRPPVDPRKRLEIIYGDRVFNVNSKKIDSMILVIKEGDSGRMRSLPLSETEPDSSVFAIQVDLTDWQDLLEVYPEAYVPPLNTLNDVTLLDRFLTQVSQKQIRRQPTVLKKHDNGLQFLQVYASEIDMKNDLERRKIDLQNEVANLQFERQLRQKYPEQDMIDLVTRQEKLNQMREMQKGEIERKSRRARKDQERRKVLLELKTDFSKLDATEQKKSLKRSQALTEQANKKYSLNQYQEALTDYETALKLAPNDDASLFYLALTQYRLEKYDDAIVNFTIANVPTPLNLQRDYYQALSHFKLEEINSALIIFRSIVKSAHPVLAPSARFYEGVILYSQEKFVEAQACFEDVIRMSEDQSLDEKADKYLTDLAWKIKYKKRNAQRFFLGLELQEIHDTNILYATDNKDEQGTTGLPDERKGWRTQVITDLGYRFIYNENHEASLIAYSNYMYSEDSTFKRADPFVVRGLLPYVFKGNLGSQSLQVKLTPSYETLYMDAEDEGERKLIQERTQIDGDVLVGIRPWWLASFSAHYGEADSRLELLTERDNADASITGYQTQQHFYLDPLKKMGVVPRVGFVSYDAEGVNRKYERTDYGLSLVRAQFYRSTIYLDWNFYDLSFPDHDEKREDENTTVRLGAKSSLHPLWTVGFDVAHSKNTSNIPANQYTKTTATVSLAFQWAK